MKFAPHVHHVADQQREARDTAAAEYALYEEGLKRLQAFLPDVALPVASREAYEDMRDLLASRHGITA